jgi:hypothetical protein
VTAVLSLPITSTPRRSSMCFATHGAPILLLSDGNDSHGHLQSSMVRPLQCELEVRKRASDYGLSSETCGRLNSSRRLAAMGTLIPEGWYGSRITASMRANTMVATLLWREWCLR